MSTEATKRYEKQHKRLRLCVRCNRKASKGRTYCKVCLKKMRERWMAQNPLFCGECKKLIKPEERSGKAGIRFHKMCSQKRARRYPEEHRLASLAYRKRHRKLGLCTSCRKKAFKGGLCRKHYKLAQERKYTATG